MEETNPCGRPVAKTAIPNNRYLIFILLAVLGALADLVSKEAVFAWRGWPGQLPPWWLIEPYVGIETAVNQGALFGFGQGKGWLFAILSIAASIGICIWLFVFKASQSRWMTVSMGLVMGGIVGNLYDRLGIPNLPNELQGGVRDWILFTYRDFVWPNFNIADSLLVSGAAMLAIHSVFLQPIPSSESTCPPSTSSKDNAKQANN
jgi:signal peptidase II